MQHGKNANEAVALDASPESLSRGLVVAVATLSEWLDERTRQKRALMRVKRALEGFRSEATRDEVARIEAVVDDVARHLDLDPEPHRG